MNGRIVRFNRIGVGLLAVLGLALVMSGQEKSPEKRAGLVTDWTSRHLVFSPPSSPEVARKVAQDPRYWQQWARRNMHPVIQAPSVSVPESSEFASPERVTATPAAKKTKNQMSKDWSVEMATAAAMGDLNFPAKYSFSTTTASCTDYAVYNTGVYLVGGSTGSWKGTFTGTTGTGSLTITNATTSFSITLTTSTTSSTAPNFKDNSGSGTTNASNFDTDATTYDGTADLNASVSRTGSTVTITGNTGAVLTFSGTITNTGTPTITQGSSPSPNATIIGYDNLYTGSTGTGGCGGSASAPPVTVAFAYNTGGTVTTSPSISLDGTQIVFVQNSGANVAQLVMLKPSLTSGGTVSIPVTLTSQASAAAYRSCVAPCMFTINFDLDAGGGTEPTNGATAAGASSSPWYDYAFDVVYVGDDRGYVHQFTGVFNADPAEVTTAPWPVAITSETSTGNTTPLTSPVFDETHGALYVGDAGGRVDWVNTSTGGVTASGKIEDATNGVYDSPLVDPSANGGTGWVYTMVANDGTTNCEYLLFGFIPESEPCSGIIRMAGEFAAGVTNASESATGYYAGTTAFTGTFDNAYYSTGTGHIIVCGGLEGGGGGYASLWDIPVTGTTMSASVNRATLTSGTANCSSVTDGFNGTTDYIYTSVTANASVGSCTAGCVVAYSVGSTGALTNTGSLAASGGTTGIIIDNFATSTGASQIYYSPMATTPCTNTTGTPTAGCAVQTAQGSL
jgi:hypothetical protein